MNILIISPWRTVAPHFETELEIAQRHRDAGHRVAFVSCLGELSACDFNPQADRDICHECRLRRADGMNKLTPRCHQLPILDRPASTPPIPDEYLASVDALKSWTIDNFDIGYACLSSLVSLTRDPQPDLHRHRSQLERFAQAARQTWESAIRLLADQRPDRVYVFNGRFAAMRAVLRACQASGVDCRVHERGCDTGHYQLFENHLPHDIARMTTRMREFWDSASGNSRREWMARAWFTGRIAGVEMNWRSFVSGQQRGLIPDNWEVGRHNVVVFTSSEDEFVAIGDCWENRMYRDQASALGRIARDLNRVRPTSHLTIRVHPNLADVDNASTRALAALAGDHVTVIPADKQIDSYQLMRMADTVATFGSAMGIEAVFWSRPSVLLGPCFYQHLRGPRRPVHHRETIRLLSDDLMPAVQHDALMYGYWQQKHGIPFRYFVADDLFTGKFKGQLVYPRPPKTIGRRMARQIESLRKRIPGGPRRRAA